VLLPLIVGVASLAPVELSAANTIPLWARKYDVSCAKCHVSVPKLNRFGFEFLARGYAMPPGDGYAAHRTVPLALWVSGRSDTRPVSAATAENVRAYLNRVEVISGGKAFVPWLSYFAEWRPVSQEPRPNGTLRKRNGRFEDLFVTATHGPLAATVGQFRQIDQIDPSRRLSISEPLVLSSSLAGSGDGTARERSLRAFAPGARSPSIRVAWNREVRGRWNWTTSAALPIPGELSLPLDEESRVEASNEIEFRRKGIFAESFVRSGPTSYGAHLFYDDAQRYLADAVTTGRAGSLYWIGIAGMAKSGPVVAGRWSVEGEYLPHRFGGVGARIEDRAGDRLRPDVAVPRAFLPYLSLSLPSTRYTFRVQLERRFQGELSATQIELGTVF